MAGWLRPGQAGDPLKWQLDLQKGWQPPGTVANPANVQYEFDDGHPGETGWQVLHSPPGIEAPVHAINWTPGAGKGEVHGPGVRAPADKLNLSIIPVTSDRNPGPSWGGVGSGQAGGTIAPEEDWRKAALLNDPGGLFVGRGQQQPGWVITLPDGSQIPYGPDADPAEVQREATERGGTVTRASGSMLPAAPTGSNPNAAPAGSAPAAGAALPADISEPGGATKPRHKAWFDPTTGFHWGQEVYDAPDSANPGHTKEVPANQPYETGRQAATNDPEFQVVITHADGSQTTERHRTADNQLLWARQTRAPTPEKPTLQPVGGGQFVWVDPNRPPDERIGKPFQLGPATPEKPPDGTTVNDPRTNKPLVIWSGGSPIALPAEKAPDQTVKDPATGKPIGQMINGTYVPSPAAHEKPLVSTTDAGTGQPIVYDPNTGTTTSLGSAPRPKPIQMGNRLIRENPETGAFEEVYRAPTTNTLVHVGNRLLSVNPETGASQEIASSPEPIRSMGNGIFLVPAGQTLKITGTKGGDRTVSGGPAGGWSNQGSPQAATATKPSSDPTKASTAPSPSSTGGAPSTTPSSSLPSSSASSTASSSSSSAATASAPQGTSSGPQGLSLFGTESPRTQQDFLAAVGGDRAKAEEMWNRQHQGEIDEIVKAGRDPATTRLSDLRSSPAAPATAPVLKPSIENNDVGVRPGPNNPPPWIPPTGDTRTVRPGPNNPPPYVPLPLPQQALLQQMGLPTVGWGQAAAPPPSITAPPEQTGWTPPIDPSQVVGGGNKFGDAVSMEGTHMGTDLQAFKGTPALSPVDGRVETVKNEPSGLGLQVSIRDASGQVHTLAHLDRAQVQVGDRVQMGQPVAAVGESGAGATGPHLDYRIAGQDGTPINPEPRMGPLAQLPPHPNTVGEGQAKKGWTPKVGTGQTIDASIWQQQMDQQASQFSQQLSLQKQGLENDMAIAKMQHEVAMKNAATAQDQERENERYNFVSQQLQRQFKFIDAQISYAQMASSQNIVKMQIAGQLTATGMNNETALRQAEMQTAAQLAGTQMNNQTQLLTQGTFGQRTTADLMKTALTNPWLQQLSGMAPGYGAPGGPGASGGGGNGGIIGDLLQGWNAGPAPNEGVEGSSLFGTDYGSLYQSAMGHDIPMNTDWLQPSQLEPIQAKELYPKGLNIGFPRTTRQGLARPENADVGGGQAQGWEPPVGSGQGVGEQLAGGSGDVATWGPYAANAQNTGGWGGYAPIQNAPPVPTWQQWQAMSPFERTSYRTLVEMSEPWALGVQKMRLKWGAEGGPLETPGTTQLGWATRDPLGKIGVAQNAEVFGEKPEYYLQNQQKAWAAGSQPGVQMIT